MKQLQDWMAVKHRTQEGDPAKLAKVLLDVADRPEQPLHLPMGSDAVEWMQFRIERDQKALEEWRTISKSTDF